MILKVDSSDMGKAQFFFGEPLAICYITDGKITIEIVNFPMNSMVNISIVFCKRLPEGTHLGTVN